MKVPEIETARLRLRRFRSDDLDALARIVADREVMQYLGNGEALDRESTKPHLKNFISNYWEQRSFGRWALDYKDNGELIGHCGFRLLEDGPELVYLLAKSYWGKGLASEAARASLRYGFEVLKFEKIVAVTHPENVASRRILEKLSFTFERYTQFYGLDCVYYSITRDTYRPDNSYYVFTST